MLTCLMLVCSVAYADSINSFSDRPALLSASGTVPLHQYAARLTGVSPFWSSSLWTDTTPPAIPIRFLISDEESRQLRTSSSFDRTIDIVMYLYRNVFMGRQRKLRAPSVACRKGEPGDHCPSNGAK
jgi:hypothetical protein